MFRPDTILPGLPPTALAPMQDVTDRAFMKTIAIYGAPDYYVTEYFRVHTHSDLEKHILEAILHNETGRPIYAQLLGDDPVRMALTAGRLQSYPIAGIDLNLGCPAPKVYKKHAGGGLLRDVGAVDRLLGYLREACPGPFTVKMRIGFEDDADFETFLHLVNKHAVDLLTVHARTVREMYWGEVRYGRIRDAVQAVSCPVMANGNISSAAKALQVLQQTGCHGVMVGRAAIRNPWIFGQIRSCLAQASRLATTVAPPPYPRPRMEEVYEYIHMLWHACGESDPGLPDRQRVARMKKYLNFIGLAVDEAGQFLYRIRRALDPQGFFAVCNDFFLAPDRRNLPYPEEPYPGLVARPSRESQETCARWDE